MKHFVILLDSRPQFVGRGAASLLQIPVGGGSLLAHFSRAADEGLGSCEIFVLPVSPMGRGYAEAIERAAGGIHVIDSLRAVVDRAEPSDVLAVIDSRRALLESYPWKELTRAAVAARGAAHLVATDDGPERAQENTWHDETGEIQCVQRYYAGVTLVRAQTVFCTLMSGAAARLAADEPLSSARQLRQTLAAADVASRDVLTVTPWVEMDQERGALSFACRRLLTPETTSVAGAQNAERAVHKAARLIGPVEIDSGAVVEAGSTIIGPVILGAGSHVLRGATVARAVIGPGVTVPAGSAVAQRVVLANENLRDEMDDEEDGSTLQSGSLRRAYASIPAGAGHRTRSRSREVYAEIKALVEAIIAIVALVMLAPLFVLTAIAIKCDSAGPVFFGHGREGRGGKRFKCWKFRTMVPDADARQRALYRDNPIDGPQFKLKTDPRVTRVGRVLRRACNISRC
ncbi:MAG: sugar transferase [Phycisphaerales bacterium]|nr:sugar transferase [Phycisphaerales bacterium]